MNCDSLQIHASLFVVNTATVSPSAKPAFFFFKELLHVNLFSSPLHQSTTVVLLWLCFSLGQKQWHKEPFKPDVEQTCKVRAAKQPRGPSLFRGMARYVDLANIWRPPRSTQKPGPHSEQRYWGSTSAVGTIQSQDICLAMCVFLLQQAFKSIKKQAVCLKVPYSLYPATRLNLNELSAMEKGHLVWLSFGCKTSQ